MNASLEVRQFLLHLEDDKPSGMPVPRAGQGQSGLRLSDDQVRRARLAVAHGASSVADCARLLDMLGLKPDEDGRSPVQR